MKHTTAQRRLAPAHAAAHGRQSVLHDGDSEAPAREGPMKPVDIAIVFLYVLLFVVYVKGCALIPVLFQ